MTERTGEIVATPAGRDLVLTRSFNAPIDDVWAAITEPQRTVRWFGAWTPGAAASDGRPTTVSVTMAFEEEGPAVDMDVVACEPPHRLALSAVDEYGSWHLDLTLSFDSGVTTLTFVHHLDASADVGEVGPGWEYYLDLLVSAETGRPQRSFDDYFPALAESYRGLLT